MLAQESSVHSGVYGGGSVASLYVRKPESTSCTTEPVVLLPRPPVNARRSDCARDWPCGGAYQGARATSVCSRSDVADPGVTGLVAESDWGDVGW